MTSDRRRVPNGVGQVYWRTEKEFRRTLQRRQRRDELRLLLSLSLLMALVAVSTVVSADAIRQLPQLWRASVLESDAGLGPRLPTVDGTFDEPPVLDGPEGTPVRIEPAVSPAPRGNSQVAQFGQAMMLQTDDYAESWRQAGLGQGRLGVTLRSHQVIAQPDGLLTGQIVATDSVTGARFPLAELRIRLLHRGILTATGRTDEQGRFEISGLTTGTYSFIAAGDDSLLAYSLHVHVAGSTEDQVEEVSLSEPPGDLLLESAALSGQDVSAALARIATLQTDGVVDVRRVEPPLERIPEAVRSIQQSGALANSTDETPRSPSSAWPSDRPGS